jgi:uncharacterized protein (TIGR02145 family)
MMKKYLLLIAFFILILQIKSQTVSDADGNTYNTVTIGTQVWMKENLKTTKYSDNSDIPNVTADTAWTTLNTPAYCWYSNNAALYRATYGALYNWFTVRTGKLCPVGWHVPVSADWDTLATYLGGSAIAGRKMKEAGTAHWFATNDADNSSVFTALPAGWRWALPRNFELIRSATAWWINDDTIHARYVQNDVSYLGQTSVDKIDGLSIRCLKHNNTSSLNIFGKVVDYVIFPNPAKDMLYINNNILKDAYVVIFDLQGKQVISRKIDSNPIDISSLSKGLYVLKIIDSGNINMNKLIKE